MRVAYLDCASGISGDMTLGALVDAGVPLEAIQRASIRWDCPAVGSWPRKSRSKGFRATQIKVEHEPEHKHRHLHHITDMIDRSTLVGRRSSSWPSGSSSGWARPKPRCTGRRSRRSTFTKWARSIRSPTSWAPPSAGICWASSESCARRCRPGRARSRSRTVACSIPAPATAELLTGIPLAESTVAGRTDHAHRRGHSGDVRGPVWRSARRCRSTRSATAPARAIWTSSRMCCGCWSARATSRAAMPAGRKTRCGFWRRIWTTCPANGSPIALQCLQEAGALDVYLTPIQMKKNRPAVILGVLCRAADITALERIIFAETGSLGIRRWPARRHTLPRRPLRRRDAVGTCRGQAGTAGGRHGEFRARIRVVSAAGGRHRSTVARDIYRAAQQAYALVSRPPATATGMRPRQTGQSRLSRRIIRL